MDIKNWQKIFSTLHMHKACIVKDFLKEHEIEAVIINKKDSSYNNFGNCEIFVPALEKDTALALIDENIRF